MDASEMLPIIGALERAKARLQSEAAACGPDDMGRADFADGDAESIGKAIAMLNPNRALGNDAPPAYGIIDPDYARVFTIARCLAWSEGYALAMQGSFTRDLDLLAVPWTDAACEPEHLARRIEEAAGLQITHPSKDGEKPHGRLVWTMTFKAFGDPRFVDLSIMPRLAASGQVPEDMLIPAVSPNGSDEDMLKYLDELLAVQGALMFARGNYNEEQGETFGVAILDFMRLYGMRLRAKLAAPTQEGKS